MPRNWAPPPRSPPGGDAEGAQIAHHQHEDRATPTRSPDSTASTSRTSNDDLHSVSPNARTSAQQEGEVGTLQQHSPETSPGVVERPASSVSAETSPTRTFSQSFARSEEGGTSNRDARRVTAQDLQATMNLSFSIDSAAVREQPQEDRFVVSTRNLSEHPHHPPPTASGTPDESKYSPSQQVEPPAAEALPVHPGRAIQEEEHTVGAPAEPHPAAPVTPESFLGNTKSPLKRSLNKQVGFVSFGGDAEGTPTTPQRVSSSSTKKTPRSSQSSASPACFTPETALLHAKRVSSVTRFFYSEESTPSSPISSIAPALEDVLLYDLLDRLCVTVALKYKLRTVAGLREFVAVELNTLFQDHLDHQEPILNDILGDEEKMTKFACSVRRLRSSAHTTTGSDRAPGDAIDLPGWQPRTSWFAFDDEHQPNSRVASTRTSDAAKKPRPSYLHLSSDDDGFGGGVGGGGSRFKALVRRKTVQERLKQEQTAKGSSSSESSGDDDALSPVAHEGVVMTNQTTSLNRLSKYNAFQIPSVRRSVAGETELERTASMIKASRRHRKHSPSDVHLNQPKPPRAMGSRLQTALRKDQPKTSRAGSKVVQQEVAEDSEKGSFMNSLLQGAEDSTTAPKGAPHHPSLPAVKVQRGPMDRRSNRNSQSASSRSELGKTEIFTSEAEALHSPVAIPKLSVISLAAEERRATVDTVAGRSSGDSVTGLNVSIPDDGGGSLSEPASPTTDTGEGKALEEEDEERKITSPGSATTDRSEGPKKDGLEDGVLPYLSLREQRQKVAHLGTEAQIRKERIAKLTSRWTKIYADISIVLLFFNFFVVSVHMGIGIEAAGIPFGFVVFEAILDLIYFFVTIGGGLLEPYEEKGLLFTSIKDTAWNYFSIPERFVFDVVSGAPLLIFALGSHDYVLLDFLRANVLLRAWRFHQHFATMTAQFSSSIHPSLWRLVLYVTHFILIITGLATAMLIMLRFSPIEENVGWLEYRFKEFPFQIDLDPLRAYLLVWYLSLVLCTAQDNVWPHTDAQFGWSLASTVCALMVIAVLIATVEEIIVEIIRNASVVLNKIEDVSGVLARMGVPDEIIEDVQMYYERMWKICRTFDFSLSADVLDELPEVLRRDIEYESNFQMLKSIPIFERVANNDDFVRSFVGELHHCMVLPGAPMVTRGELGDCLFFISSGDGAVLSAEDNSTVIMDLHAGSFFGEVSMLFGGVQENTIVAVTLCVCYVMTDEQFDALIDRDPKTLEVILQTALDQLKKSGAELPAATQSMMFDGDGQREPWGTVVNPLEAQSEASSSVLDHEADNRLAVLRNAYRGKSLGGGSARLAQADMESLASSSASHSIAGAPGGFTNLLLARSRRKSAVVAQGPPRDEMMGSISTRRGMRSFGMSIGTGSSRPSPQQSETGSPLGPGESGTSWASVSVSEQVRSSSPARSFPGPLE